MWLAEDLAGAQRSRDVGVHDVVPECLPGSRRVGARLILTGAIDEDVDLAEGVDCGVFEGEPANDARSPTSEVRRKGADTLRLDRVGRLDLPEARPGARWRRHPRPPPREPMAIASPMPEVPPTTTAALRPARSNRGGGIHALRSSFPLFVAGRGLEANFSLCQFCEDRLRRPRPARPLVLDRQGVSPAISSAGKLARRAGRRLMNSWCRVARRSLHDLFLRRDFEQHKRSTVSLRQPSGQASDGSSPSGPSRPAHRPRPPRTQVRRRTPFKRLQPGLAIFIRPVDVRRPSSALLAAE